MYIYRNSPIGLASKRSLWANECLIGTTAPNVFFYTEVKGDTTHTIATQSEFSPNTIDLTVESGKNYFLRQYIKLGVLVYGANLEIIDEEKGKEDILKLKMAKGNTNCVK